MTLRSCCLAAFALLIGTASPPAESGGWEVNDSTTALTGAASTVAVLRSTSPLLNMIGAPTPALLVLRCQERVIAAYVSWPQVLTHDVNTFMGRPQTIVLWRFDDGPIQSDFWIRSDDGIAAGKFETKPALKLIAQLAGVKRLVVRMTGQSAQDAVFDLSGIDDAIAKVEHTCGVVDGAPR